MSNIDLTMWPATDRWLSQVTKAGSGIPIAPAGSPFFWFKSGVGVTNVSGSISAWTDQGTGANNISQGTAGNRPTIQSAALNGFDTYRSTNVSGSFVTQYLASGSITGIAQPWDIWMVLKMITWSAGTGMFSTPANGENVRMNTVSPGIKIDATTPIGPLNSLAVGTWGVVRATFNGASSQIQINNGTAVTGSAGTTNLNGIVLGNPFLADGVFEIAEAFGFNAVQNTTDAATNFSYAQGKYAIP